MKKPNFCLLTAILKSWLNYLLDLFYFRSFLKRSIVGAVNRWSTGQVRVRDRWAPTHRYIEELAQIFAGFILFQVVFEEIYCWGLQSVAWHGCRCLLSWWCRNEFGGWRCCSFCYCPCHPSCRIYMRNFLTIFKPLITELILKFDAQLPCR